MKIEIRKSSSIIGEILTDGHSPLKVLGDDFNTYIVKNDKGQKPPFFLLNECIASSFLNIWNLHSPSTCLMEVDKGLVEELENLSIAHKSIYYDNKCFASQHIPNAVDLNGLVTTIDKKAYNKIINPLEFLRLALFDTWIENDDRKPTNYNLLLATEGSKLRVVPIDHAYILNSIGYEHLNPTTYFPISNEHLLVSDFGRMIKHYYPTNEKFIKESEQYFYICTEQCAQQFDTLVEELSIHFNFEVEYMKPLKEYLFHKDRNRRVFEEFVYRLTQ